MSPVQIAALGAVAGFTIYVGLPMARLKTVSLQVRELLNATATGILLFLLWDVLSHAVDPVETSMNEAVTGKGSWAGFIGLSTVATIGLGVGLISLVYYERWMSARGRRVAPSAGFTATGGRPFGPGAMAIDEPAAKTGGPRLNLADPTRRLAILIATGIGLHNFSEGLAIGQSAANGEISLAVMLIVGFGLHNATEGFGITAPFAAGGIRPSWRFLGVLGLIGGGPTLLGTVLGQSFVNDTVYICFLALAAGSILYVVVQLLGVAVKLGRTPLLYWGLLIGLLLGFATDFIVTAAGA